MIFFLGIYKVCVTRWHENKVQENLICAYSIVNKKNYFEKYFTDYAMMLKIENNFIGWIKEFNEYKFSLSDDNVYKYLENWTQGW